MPYLCKCKRSYEQPEERLRCSTCAELKSLRTQVKETGTVLAAWQSVFGTSQLSHARARLEVAERDVESLRVENAKLKADNEAFDSDVEKDLERCKKMYDDKCRQLEELKEYRSACSSHGHETPKSFYCSTCGKPIGRPVGVFQDTYVGLEKRLTASKEEVERLTKERDHLNSELANITVVVPAFRDNAMSSEIARLEAQLAEARDAIPQYPDTEAGGVVFCGKCGKARCSPS